MKPYITVALLWKTATEAIPVPVLGVHATNEEASQNAYAGLVQAALGFDKDVLSYPVTVTPIALTDDIVREFLVTLAQRRPDLLAPERVKRGRDK